jgi:tetratricopeptide (TPR) repeat protein
MKTKITLLTLLLFISGAIFPCGNSYHRSENTEVYQQGNSLGLFTFKEAFNNNSLLAELNKLADEVKSGFNLFEDENDKALTYMRMGKYKDAFEILTRLEKEKPNEYNIIANLGTLYELKGENETALVYIKRAVALNSQSHHGSEWFHIQVLEAKIQGKGNDWWKSHSILNLNTIRKDPEIIISDITYQLKERLPFTKKPDGVMAAILNETGDYLANHKKQEQAWITYKIGMEYEPDSSFKLKEKIDGIETYFSKNNIALPDYKSHFIKTEDLLETGKDLLDKGIDLYTKHQEKVQEKQLVEKKKANTLWIIGGAVVAISLLAFFSLRKKKSV